MKQSRIKDENYFQVSGWMLNRLHLKGISLELFAIIYGFSQDGESCFTGSLQYLCDFTGTSRPTVIKALKELVSLEYLIKTEIEKNGVKFNEYKANLQVVKKLNTGNEETLQEDSKEPLQGGSKEPLHNNKSFDNKELNNSIKYIIDYLNQKAKTEYRYTTKATQKLLKGLLTGEYPYTVQDCITVIDKKCAEWKGTEFEKYLRPSTLFGTKFENYLNAKIGKGNTKPNPKNDGWCFDPNEDDDLDFIK